ncbi:HNH endonuclease [Rhodopirellula halodulae]|uniref:HNH endonuclease n=1 Tax=Rhodopirellula halodulae TaxID=2894198 RepID=UPI0034D46DB1
MTPAWHFCLRPIPERDGYFASIDGHIWSMRKGGPSHWPPRQEPLRMKGMRVRKGPKKGRHAIKLSLGSRERYETHEVSHLVFETFRGERPAGLFIWHRDGDLSNNALTNLGCDTPADSIAKRQALGRIPVAMTAEERFTDDEFLHIVTSQHSTRQLAHEYRVSQSKVLMARQSPPKRFLANQAQQDDVLALHIPSLRCESHRMVLRWLVSRMLPCGFVRVDTPLRRDELPLGDSTYWPALLSLVSLGVIAHESRGAYRVSLGF